MQNKADVTLTQANNDKAKTSATKRVQLTVQTGVYYENTFNLYYRCLMPPRTVASEMLDTQGIFDFTVTIQTDLNIIFFGDSVGVQFAQGFQESVGSTFFDRKVLRYSWGTHEGLFVSAPVDGGGVVAGWRCTGLLQYGGENMPLPNIGGGGWVRSDAKDLLQHEYQQDQVEINKTVSIFDAMIMRIPHGWIKLEQITEKSLNESVYLAHELFGVKTIVIILLPLNNNVQTLDQYLMLQDKNNMIRLFSQNWPKGNGGVDWILTLEFGRFSNLLIEWNGMIIGINTTLPPSEWLFTYTCCDNGRGFRQHVALVCSEFVTDRSTECIRNMISLDGMHWCMESIAGRLNAAFACLLSCVYNYSGKEPIESSQVRACERNCNDDYMSLKPVKETSPV